jgi:uncharacterized protein with PQ loop repeat
LVDIVLLGQCFYYKGFTLTDDVKRPGDTENGNYIHAPLLQERTELHENATVDDADDPSQLQRSESLGSFRDHILTVDGTHLSPATPLVPGPSLDDLRPSNTPSALKMVFFNAVAIVLVCTAGVLGWWLSSDSKTRAPKRKYDPIDFSPMGQVFGYICAALYLGSRIPQLLLNYRRKSTEGISMLFFLFACLGNLTYVLSIVYYEPVCIDRKHCAPGEAARLYWRYIGVNASWILGSFGTLLLDTVVFVQFFLYKDEEDSEREEGSEEETSPLAVDYGTVIVRHPNNTRRAVEFENTR